MSLNFRRFVFLLVLFGPVSSCTNKALFDEIATISEQGWHYQDQLKFTIPVNDTSEVCNVLLHVRNTKVYDYSNLWLFVTTTAPNGDSQRDTLEILLADQAGYWLGKGTRSINSMLVSYLREVKFPYRGVYIMEVQHAMRDTLLENVVDLGIRVEPSK